MHVLDKGARCAADSWQDAGPDQEGASGAGEVPACSRCGMRGALPVPAVRLPQGELGCARTAVGDPGPVSVPGRAVRDPQATRDPAGGGAVRVGNHSVTSVGAAGFGRSRRGAERRSLGPWERGIALNGMDRLLEGPPASPARAGPADSPGRHCSRYQRPSRAARSHPPIDPYPHTRAPARSGPSRRPGQP